jgi:hypothetical protein
VLGQARRAARGTTGGAARVPTGRQLLLGAPGLTVEATQDGHAEAPTFTFGPGPVTLDESDYRPGK